MIRKTLYGIGAILLVLLIAMATQFHSDIPVEKLKVEYAQPPSKFMDLDGMQVHYRDEGSGFPVVLIHGTSSSLHTWDEWTDILLQQYRVIRMDLPAFGLTGPNADNKYGIHYYVSFIEHFLSKLGIKECYMAGNSLGGEITWEYAAAHPDQVKKMILIDAAGYPLDKIPDAFKLARNPVTKVCMRYITPRFIFAKSLKEVYGDPSKVTDSLVNRYFDLGLRQGNREALIAEVNQVSFDDTATIATIKTPTLLVWGENDRWIPIKHAYQFKRDITGSKLISYPGLGHVPMEEDPVATVNDAMRFFEKDTI